MNETPTPVDGSTEPESCVLCSAALTRDSSFQKVLCRRCYRMLLGAGMSDEQISQMVKRLEDALAGPDEE